MSSCVESLSINSTHLNHAIMQVYFMAAYWKISEFLRLAKNSNVSTLFEDCEIQVCPLKEPREAFVRCLPCRHTFHAVCLLNFKGDGENRDGKCPKCRNVFEDVVDLTVVKNRAKVGRIRQKKKTASPGRLEPYAVRRKERRGNRRKVCATECDEALSLMISKSVILVDPFFESYSKLYSADFKRPAAPGQSLPKAQPLSPPPK